MYLLQAPSQDPRLLIPAILVSLGFLIVSVFFANRLFMGEIKNSITKLVMLILVALVCIWISNATIFLNRSILTTAQSDNLFSLISGLVLTIVGYYFGSQSKDKE